MRKSSLIPKVAVILTTVMLYSCGKNCPGFPDKFMEFIPYQNGETLRFVNENEDTVCWKCIYKWKQHPEYLEWNCKCVCAPRYTDIIFKTDCNEEIKISISIERYDSWYDPGKTNLLESAIWVNWTGYDDPSRVLHCQTSPTFSCIDDDVQITHMVDTLLFTSSDTTIIDSVCVVLGHGIVSFKNADGSIFRAE